MTLREIEKRLAEVNSEAAELVAQRDEKRRDQRIPCSKCGRRTALRRLTYIQTHWYVKPYGCTGGDYWREGEGQYDCPRCGHRNRLYDRPDVKERKRYFGKVEEAYDR